ncbi:MULTISPECIES: MotA/TolQ/ExbB proton channel family protein [unclassified Pseudodesulfovibrio]|uniref:MotA/TolQ/ExbB proton channel family protein n=1 Tax=unclassified Pseudodesulfovibrio TaxID=2661612 RepID=UPI000FEC1DF2|nr:MULTISPECIES: MotA/TolQ/ExbB proton channel family protein [unclassified Pseudodesulfovibrio]MCJ2163388.1 MotA/TolQ/ExbB proton channel family protein [Pseudodesulfovibrio sp. S3-i]RWU06625.1 flagellar motor protein MotA [Pseudodesulfovibrio sp. S3]
MRTLIVTYFFVLALSMPAYAQQWQQVAQQVTTVAGTVQENVRQTESIIAQERREISAEKNALQDSIDVRQKEFSTLKAQYDALLQQEKVLQEELAEQAHELKTIDGTIRTAAKQARDYFHESLTTPEFPQRETVLAEVLQPEKFPGLEGIQNLLTLLLEELQVSGTVARRTGSFIGTDGKDKTGDLLRIGSFTMAYRLPDGSLGFLRPGNDASTLVAVQGAPGWKLSGLMREYFEGKGTVFPVDISNGAAFTRLAQDQKGIYEWLSAGGLLVWPIILVGIAALVLVVERFYSLSKIRGNSDRNMATILGMVDNGKWKECRQFCREQSMYPTCRIIGHTLKYLGNTREIIENAFQEGLLKELPMLERFLPTLNVLAAVAPLLGLLGTVTGMINTFQIITVYGTGDPRMMSGGISEALVTTQLGLAVAVPIMILHHILERRVDKIIGDMEEKGTGFAVALMKLGKIKTREELDAAA